MSQITRNLIGMPIFNEENYLKQTLDLLKPILDADPFLDLLLYNDGSTDASVQIIQQAKNEWPDRIIIEQHSNPKGYGQTIIDILQFARVQQHIYQTVITFDADLQHDPHTIPIILSSNVVAFIIP